MQEIKCATQAELDAILKDGNMPIICGGWFNITKAPKVIVAEGQPHVEARESSQPHVVAWGSSQPHVEAWAYAQLSVSGPATVSATDNVSVLIRGALAKVTGGKQTRIVINDAKDWCEFYGVPLAADGSVILYKAVRADHRSSRGGNYTPGTIPFAPDWDGGKAECGGGLHFAPHPSPAKSFDAEATKYVACPVALNEIVVHPDGLYPEKVKAPRCCGPVVECDRFGKVITEKRDARD